jgi:hypothetical protein
VDSWGMKQMASVRDLSRAALALGLLLAASACAPDKTGPAAGGPGGSAARPPETVRLRYKLSKDQRLRYDLRLTLNSDGEAWTDEKLRAIVNQLCLGQFDNPGGDSGLFMLNILREEVERTKRVKDSGGKEQPVIRLVRNVEPDISAAYGYDRERNLNYFPCDQRGRFALTKDAKFHRVTYDSLVYLLPVLPAEEVAAGSIWVAEIPVYAGTDYVYGQGQYRGGSDFPLKITGKVEKIYTRGENVLVQFSWKAAGAFDSQGYADRFAPSFHTRQRLIHEVDAEGRATFDATRGLVLAKDGRAAVTFTSLVRVARERGEPKWEKTVARHRLSYRCELISDGTAPATRPQP